MSDTALTEAIRAWVDEMRRTRRWRFWGRLAVFSVLALVALSLLGEEDEGFSRSEHTALINIKGEIGGLDGVLADDVIAALADVYKANHVKGIVLRINSSGGSPVHAGQIYDEIRRQKQLHPNIPLVVTVDDICASGGYYIAAAADSIFVDKASIVGSIGVVMDGFGFTGAMQKLGIERRMMTAGEHKGFLDPFLPRRPQSERHIQAMIDEVHTQFIAAVRNGRGKRLKEDADIFSGLVWSGTRAVELGLADGLGNLNQVAREVIGTENIIDYSYRETLPERLMRRLGTSIGTALQPWARESAQLR